MFEYFRDKISNKGVIFLQKIRYSEDTFDKRQDDFKWVLFMIFLGHKTLNAKKISADANGRIVIIGELIDDEIILLIIPYFSPNTEMEQV